MHKKTVTSVAVLIICTACIAVFAQEKKFHESYNPIQLAKRLSYENFRDLKLLQVAIMNYGGGKEEVDRLIDQYAEASALYFQQRHVESASLFQDNQKDILQAAKRITTKYKEVAEKLFIDSTKKTIKDELSNTLKGKKIENSPEVFLSRARFAVSTANDYYDRFKDATTASPINFVKAIFYYRRAKENMIQLFITIETDQDKKKQLEDQYKKDIADNDNKIYQAKEKNP